LKIYTLSFYSALIASKALILIAFLEGKYPAPTATINENRIETTVNQKGIT